MLKGYRHSAWNNLYTSCVHSLALKILHHKRYCKIICPCIMWVTMKIRSKNIPIIIFFLKIIIRPTCTKSKILIKNILLRIELSYNFSQRTNSIFKFFFTSQMYCFISNLYNISSHNRHLISV